ncbi:zinc ribbon domain-containing protein [Cylindrospermum sp. FACHB-282]|uniref:zinc ribbon domain-containing protein n=1 Tax=Cylindrospermum sp. FACHB-282 TaxID=2692794 RepID=UPI001684A25E|nr:zinc ribbon domain-containing protein [Cylindrospermum sp. FACHB-282]MBD2388047.1 zinc ribbon domain-containing protein [Cylindrospermum sp. FACHB-282]
MATVSCSRCHQLIDSQAITCPNCRITLKAYGHPGIPLHRATKDGYLCNSCTYHFDDTCNFPQRPYAKDCTLYQNIEETKLELQQQRHASSFGATVKTWLKHHQALLLLLALLLVCLLIALSTS